jgi:hypothetical protein
MGYEVLGVLNAPLLFVIRNVSYLICESCQTDYCYNYVRRNFVRRLLLVVGKFIGSENGLSEFLLLNIVV